MNPPLKVYIHIPVYHIVCQCIFLSQFYWATKGRHLLFTSMKKMVVYQKTFVSIVSWNFLTLYNTVLEMSPSHSVAQSPSHNVKKCTVVCCIATNYRAPLLLKPGLVSIWMTRCQSHTASNCSGHRGQHWISHWRWSISRQR